jgi:hypothetical protein
MILHKLENNDIVLQKVQTYFKTGRGRRGVRGHVLEQQRELSPDLGGGEKEEFETKIFQTESQRKTSFIPS